MHQQLWGYKVEWKSVSRGTGGKKVEYHWPIVWTEIRQVFSAMKHADGHDLHIMRSVCAKSLN